MRRILFILFFLPVMAWAGKDTPAKRLVSLLTECREREELVPDSFFSDVLLLKREIREQKDSAAKAVYSAGKSSGQCGGMEQGGVSAACDKTV